MEVTVVTRPREVVSAARQAQERWLPMSNLDLLIPPSDVGVFFCYRKVPETSASSCMNVLKTALSEVLATYYPFAGEVMCNPDGKPGFLCNNRGVDLIKAQCDICLASLQLHDPQDRVMKALMPEKKEGVLCVQATELKCGGVVVACSFDHRVADAYSANMFFVAWAEAARSVPFSAVPSFNRSPISPRPGYALDGSIENIYAPSSQLPPPQNVVPPASVDRIYYVTASNIARIQALASPRDIHTRTKLEAFTALLWQVLGRVRANGSQCRMGILVDGRKRIRGSLETYFGNVLSLPFATLTAEKLQGMELADVANEVHNCISRAATEEHFIRLINKVEAHKPDPLVSRIVAAVGGDDGNMAVVVSSGRQFPLSAVDFGWGRPVIASYCFPWGCNIGYVMPMPSAREDGNWVVYVQMEAQLVALLETAAGDVFRPVTADNYLELHID